MDVMSPVSLVARPDVHASGRARRHSGLRTVGSLLPYLWPEADNGACIRLGLAVVLLVLAKVATSTASNGPASTPSPRTGVRPSRCRPR